MFHFAEIIVQAPITRCYSVLSSQITKMKPNKSTVMASDKYGLREIEDSSAYAGTGATNPTLRAAAERWDVFFV